MNPVTFIAGAFTIAAVIIAHRLTKQRERRASASKWKADLLRISAPLRSKIISSRHTGDWFQDFKLAVDEITGLGSSPPSGANFKATQQVRTAINKLHDLRSDTSEAGSPIYAAKIVDELKKLESHLDGVR